jgi:pimeloyl-ACP methyl ester carboxylesterase
VPLVDVTAVIGPSGGTMKLSDGAGLDVAPGVVEGNMTFRLSTVGGGGAGGGIALTAEHSQSLSVSGTTTPSDCVSYVTHQLTMVPGSGASFVSGNNAVTLRLPIPCSPAPNQSLYFSAQLDGVSTDILWKTAKSDVDRLTASTTLTGNQLLTLNTKASTTLSLLPVVVTAGDLLACTVGGKQYPALVKEPDANPATSRKYAVVLVHGWLKNVTSCGSAGAPNGSFAREVVFGSMPGAKYFPTLLPSLQDLTSDTWLYTYTYPTYRPFTEPGQDLVKWLNSEFGPTGPEKDVKAIVIVAHSMGGLVARSAAQDPALYASVAAKLRGTITLATPHLGTPAVLSTDIVTARWWLPPGTFTPGGQSLSTDFVLGAFPRPESESTPIIAYAGSLPTRCERTIKISPTCSPAVEFESAVAWNSMCLVFLECDTDGVVSVSSALPTFASRRYPVTRAWGTYTHSEMKEGRLGVSDPLFASVIADIRSLQGTTPTEVAGANVNVSLLGGPGVCIMSKYLSPIQSDGAKTWSAHFTKGARYPGGTLLRDVNNDINQLSCEYNQGLLGSASVAGGLAAGDQIYLTISEPDGSTKFAVWTWDGTTMIPRLPSGESLVTSLFSPGFSDITLVGSSFYYFHYRQYYGCNSQSLEKVAAAGGPVTVLARDIDCPLRMVADGQYVYWLEMASTGFGFIKRVAVTGGAVETLASTLKLNAQSGQPFIVDAGYVYFAVSVDGDPPGVQRIRRMATTGGAIADVVSAAQYPAFAVSDGTLYYEDVDPALQCQSTPATGRISAVPVSGGASVSLGTGVFSCAANSLLVNGTTLYVIHGAAANILSVGSTSGGALTTRVTGLQNPTRLITDGTSLFLSDNGKVLRFNATTFEQTVVSWWRDASQPLLGASSLYWASTVALRDNCCGGAAFTSIIRVPR